MKYRTLGNTDLRLSALGFGCGAIGGLMVRGKAADRIRAVARAVEAGINYFDTAQMYGEGASETHLGQALAELRPDVVVGSKVTIQGDQMNEIENAFIAGAELSLQRLQLDHLDLFYVHNLISTRRDPARNLLEVADLEPIANACQKLQSAGKIHYWGFNGLGESAALLQAVDQYPADLIQSCCNLINPSTVLAAPTDFPFQDYGQLATRAATAGMGVVAFRIMAGGGLCGDTTRHPVAAQSVDPIATNADLASDAAHAQRFAFLIEQGFVSDLPEAAIRFALSLSPVTSALIGLSDLDQLEQAIAATEKGSLPQAALEGLLPLWSTAI